MRADLLRAGAGWWRRANQSSELERERITIAICRRYSVNATLIKMITTIPSAGRVWLNRSLFAAIFWLYWDRRIDILKNELASHLDHPFGTQSTGTLLCPPTTELDQSPIPHAALPPAA